MPRRVLLGLLAAAGGYALEVSASRRRDALRCEGKVRRRTPGASKMALPMAAPTGQMGFAGAESVFLRAVDQNGSIVGTREGQDAVGRPVEAGDRWSSQVTSSFSARPIPWMTLPSI